MTVLSSRRTKRRLPRRRLALRGRAVGMASWGLWVSMSMSSVLVFAVCRCGAGLVCWPEELVWQDDRWTGTPSVRSDAKVQRDAKKSARA